jgi:hypothetical protein
MADRAKFLDFLDMIDGGGAGKMGDKFQGGGIFSMLANAIATPYGSEDEARKRARMQAYGLLGDKAPAASIMSTPVPAVQPVMRPKPRPDNLNVPAPAPSGEDLLMSMPVAPSAETNRMGAMLNVPSAYNYASMGQRAGNVAAPAAPAAPARPAQAAVPSMEQYQAVAKQLMQEMGNAFLMMPREEQILRIQQRMRGM